MIRTLRYLFLLLFLIVTGNAFGQGAPGEITGTVVDDKKEPVIGAVVEITDNGGIVKGGAQTDVDGNYSVKPLAAGRYTVTVRFLGYKTSVTTGVIVSPDKTTGVNLSLETNANVMTEVVVTAPYVPPLVDKYQGGGTKIMTSETLEALPTRQTNDMISTGPGVYQATAGGGLSLGGAQSTGTLYVIDGVQVQGQGNNNINLPQGAIDQMEVMTGGISAKYGDASGGVVNITTKGVAQRLTGGVTAQHSIDGYNNNLLSANVSGPLYSKKDSTGRKKAVMGFLLGGDFYYDNVRYPYYEQTYVAKPDVLEQLKQNPLRVISDASGNQVYRYSTEYVTKDQMEQVKIPPNNKYIEARLNGKLDYQLAENINVALGGNFNYSRPDAYSRGQAMFAPESIPYQNGYTGRGWLRFTQRFGKGNSVGEGKSGSISNAYYTIQADYQKNYVETQSEKFKKNLFDYSYIGKFTPTYMSFYQPNGLDSVSQLTGVKLISDYAPVSVQYERADVNPELSNYTSQYYNTSRTLPQTLQQIQANRALINGDQPASTYSLFANVGTGITGYSLSSSDQYSLSADASFDLQLGKTTHSIGFGLYYQQRISRNFSATMTQGGTQSLWQLMRAFTDPTNNLKLDASHPIFVVGGQRYSLEDVNNGVVIPGPADTILYNYTRSTTQNAFDRNLRKKLGLNPDGVDYINVDGLDRSTFSLDMFSADQLLNSGNSYVGYQGYSYSGQKQNNVSFNDFWTAQDANGYSRPIAPFSPNYIAGYILDKFRYKDILFNVGVRIDRYDANTSVLKDPYSFYETYKAGNTPEGAVNLINGGTPSNIGKDYVVYVDNNAATHDANVKANIIGYRNGDTWYDATGRLIEDPAALKAYTGGRDPQPYLVNPESKITDTNFNPTNSFANYKPQVNVMPRLSFSFPISDVALFFAHYDIYVQRPTSGINATALQYYFINNNANQIINNPDLKPQKTFDYEVGFTQKLSTLSALTLTAYYKERKDFIAVRPYLYAWPITYYTYGNRDFTTTKGLTMRYELRRVSHFRADISYTLQFAEGTGSNPNSSNTGSGGQISNSGLLSSFIQAGLPNMRYTTSLDYDSRHMIAATLDYRYSQGEGPIVGGKHIFQNMGLDVVARARSGEPYTRYAEAIGNRVVGEVNGSRLPWHVFYGFDARLNKEFALDFSKKSASSEASAGMKQERPLYLNAFIYVQNLFNVRDVLGVYGYTGRPDDNGYLTSPQGAAFVRQQTSPQAYTDMYNISINNPGNYNLPRQMYLGLTLNF